MDSALVGFVNIPPTTPPSPNQQTASKSLPSPHFTSLPEGMEIDPPMDSITDSYGNNDEEDGDDSSKHILRDYEEFDFDD